MKTVLQSFKTHPVGDLPRSRGDAFGTLSTAFKLWVIPLLLLLGVSRQGWTQTETFPSGSYIINMGIKPQTQANALRPYGLIYDLLKNDKIPVKWVVSQSKGIDGVDFNHQGVDCRGGTFIIPAPHRNGSVNSKINSYGVTDNTTTPPLTVNVNIPLSCPPKYGIVAMQANDRYTYTPFILCS
jgi:hypothetical protein